MTPIDYLIAFVAGSGSFIVLRAIGVAPAEDRRLVSRDLPRRRWH